MVMDLLQLFARSCGNRLPTKIIFYRDGVDDGQYQKVLDNEVTKIKHAFRGKNESYGLIVASVYLVSDLWHSSSAKIDFHRGEKATQYPSLRLRWSSNEER